MIFFMLQMQHSVGNRMYAFQTFPAVTPPDSPFSARTQNQQSVGSLLFEILTQYER